MPICHATFTKHIIEGAVSKPASHEDIMDTYTLLKERGTNSMAAWPVAICAEYS